MNNKGLLASIVVLIIILFLLGVFGLFVRYIWSHVETVVDDLPADVAANYTKLEIQEKITPISYYPDKLFVYVFIALLIAYIISAVSIPPENAVFLVVFFFILIFLSVFAMILSNGWVYLTTQTDLSAVVTDLPFTDFFMKFMPFITFFTGVIGAMLFYTRNKGEFNKIGGFQE